MTKPDPPAGASTGETGSASAETGGTVPRPRFAADEATTPREPTATETGTPQPGAAAGARGLSDSSVRELFDELERDLSTLVRQELTLARAELKQEVTKTAKGAGAFGVAAFAGYMTLLFVSIAVWSAVSYVIGPAWSGLVVAGAWGVVTAILSLIGHDRFREMSPRPERTVDTVRDVPEAVKGQRRDNS